MHTLTLTDEELQLLHNALETWIYSFSHDQPDLLRAGKELRGKLEGELGTTIGTGGTSTFSSN